MSSVNAEWVNTLRGQWIVIEGPDRVGKTTLINEFINYLLSKGLAKADIVRIAFPRRQYAIGDLLNKHLKSEMTFSDKTQVLLFLADMEEAYNTIREAQEQKKLVICDRYTASTFSYAMAQASLRYCRSDLSEEWLKNAISLVKQPNIYVFLLPDMGDYVEFTNRSVFGKAERTETLPIQENVILYMKHYALTCVKETTRKIVVNLRPTDKPLDVLDTFIRHLAIKETKSD